MIIAIDFDETITDNTPYPFKGNVRKDAIKYIKKLYINGYTLVLWTARTSTYYNECIQQLKDSNIYQYFDFSYTKKGFTGKLIADFYIDDKSIPGNLNWRKIYKYIIKNVKEVK